MHFRLISASLKHYSECSGKCGDAFGVLGGMAAVFCALVGSIIHAANLDTEPATRSFAMAFMGANFSFTYLYFAVATTNWSTWAPLVVITSMSGLVLGVISYEGDPQAETKKKATQEQDYQKKLTEAKDAKASWDRLNEELKLKLETAEKGNDIVEVQAPKKT